jgi:opacity protein-like surface antigen
MKTRTSLIRFCLALLWASVLAGPAGAQDTTAYFHFFGGLNRVFEYGCDCDYELGVNDFPVTPAHDTGTVGFGFGYGLGKGFVIELDGRYNSNAEVKLTDPSDGDTVKIDTAKHYSVTANLLYRIGRGGIQPYLLAGAGIDTLVDVDTKTLETDMGFEFILNEPEKKTDFMFNLGGGVEFLLSRTFRLRLDARYINIPKTDDHAEIQSLNATAGLAFHF